MSRRPPSYPRWLTRRASWMRRPSVKRRWFAIWLPPDDEDLL